VFNEYCVYDERDKECESLDIEVMECFLIVGLSLNIAHAHTSKQVKCIHLNLWSNYNSLLLLVSVYVTSVRGDTWVTEVKIRRLPDFSNSEHKRQLVKECYKTFVWMEFCVLKTFLMFLPSMPSSIATFLFIIHAISGRGVCVHIMIR